MRWLAVVLGAAVLAVAASVVVVLRASGVPGIVEAGAGDEFTDPCGTFTTAATTPYPVSGYFIIPTTDRCTWRRQLEQIHKVGGDTVVRLGFNLSPRSVDGDGRILDAAHGAVDRRYAVCVDNGLSCVRAAEKDLRAANPGNRISQVYVFRTDERYGDGVFRCPGMEHRVVADAAVFYRLLAPEDGSDDPTCDFRSQARAYRLILISADRVDSLTELLNLGDRFGIKVFPALPMAPRDPDDSTRADPRHMGALTTLTRRILRDYGDRFADRDALGGVYQPFEVRLRDWPDPSKVQTLQVYTEQHRIVEQVLPGKPILVSPYMDARRRLGKYTSTPAQVAAGFRELAKTGVGIIAPQDGRGTGKGALFWAGTKDQPVDERLEPVVGSGTYDSAYYGSTRDYYRAMAEARDDLAEHEGIEVELWANVEGFEPTGTKACGRQHARGRTDKSRLDAQIALAGPYVSKIISYMWSDFFTCGSPSLAQQLERDWRRPIAVEAFRRQRNAHDGLQIRGYYLRDALITLSWPGVVTPRVIDSARVGQFDAAPAEGLPRGVEGVWIPVDWASIPGDTWIKVEVTAPDGRRAAEPVYHRNTG